MNLVKCTRCKNVFLDEEYDNHTCKPVIIDSKTIRSASYYIVKDDKDQTVIGVTTLSGTHYEFPIIVENKEHTKIPYQPTCNTDNYQPRSKQNLVTDLQINDSLNN